MKHIIAFILLLSALPSFAKYECKFETMESDHKAVLISINDVEGASKKIKEQKLFNLKYNGQTYRFVFTGEMKCDQEIQCSLQGFIHVTNQNHPQKKINFFERDGEFIGLVGGDTAFVECGYLADSDA